jgi:predicted MFS family arabinose efflux permease
MPELNRPQTAAVAPAPASAPAPAPAPDLPIPALAIVCLSLAACGSATSLRISDALLPRLAGEFAVSLSTAAQVISAFAIAYGVAQLLFGPLGDRFGKYRVIAWACAACALTASLCGLASDFTTLRLARALAGATAAAIVPLSMAWIGDVVAYEDRQPVLARFLIGQIVGLSGGVWLGGFAADHLSWRTPYFMIGVLFALVSAALFVLNRRLPARARTLQLSTGSPLRRMASDFRHVFSKPWARVVLATVFLEGVFLYGPFAFIASHLHLAFGVSLSAAGSLVMLFGLGGLLYAAFAGRLVRGLGEVGLVRWGGALLSASLLVVGFAPAWQWSAPGCLVAGLGFYMLHNTLQINATQMAPERRGAAVSAFAASFFLGQSAGVALAGWVVERLGVPGAMGIGAIGVLAVAGNFARLRSSLARRG